MASAPYLIDGGLATELESSGVTLHPRLWSGGLVFQNPQAIVDAHRRFLESGARVLITANYQLSMANLAAEGFSRDAAIMTMQRAVALAAQAREEFLSEHAGEGPIWIAASVGPYGAILCDGSEYTGNYGLDDEDLGIFHRERIKVLRQTESDFLAVETLPSYREARVLRGILDELPEASAWVSFSCRDEKRLADGSDVETAAELFADCSAVFAVGVNCVPPGRVGPLVEKIEWVCRKPWVAYPNSGEVWDEEKGAWCGPPSAGELAEWASQWDLSGAWGLGGCCRVGPEAIQALANHVKGRMETER